MRAVREPKRVKRRKCSKMMLYKKGKGIIVTKNDKIFI
jgi:hypothetical protein